MRKADKETYADCLHIQLLDRLEIVFGSQSVEEALRKSRKARALVSLLILRKGEPVSFAELYEALWEGGEQADLDNVLKVLVSRTRSMLAGVSPVLRECIISQPGAYRWNMEMTAEVDVFAIEKLCAELQQADTVTETFQKKLDTLMCMYAGRLLPEEAEASWVQEYAGKLEDLYKATVIYSIGLLQDSGDAKAVVRVCRMGLATMPFETRWHDNMMRAMVNLDRGEAEELEEETAEKHDHAGGGRIIAVEGTPLGVVEGLHEDLEENDRGMGIDIDALGESLGVGVEFRGAQMCDFSVFRYIYEQQLRIADRYGLSFYLVLLKVSSITGEELQPLMLEDVMQKLGDVLRINLRKGDTVARHTSLQYAVLLQDPAIGSIMGILERVRLAFYQNVRNTSVALDYRYKELDRATKSGHNAKVL